MKVVLIIPTGIGCRIGGHSGDANPVAKLLAGCCDELIVHPNVVNAADLNEMTDNMLYVEGSILNRFLKGEIHLKKVYQNKILLVVNKPLTDHTYNAVSAARYTIGVNIDVIELDNPLVMRAVFAEDGHVTGEVQGVSSLVNQLKRYKFDALALHTPIQVNREVALNYYQNGGINPWGGVEAKCSKMIANRVNKPVAHAPLETCFDDSELFDVGYERRTPPRIAAEAISFCYLQSVLKGLNKAPRIASQGLHSNDIDFLVSPYGCFGLPHEACLNNEIPMIIVRNNTTIYNKCCPGIHVNNYLEAVGVITARKAGVDTRYVN